EYMTFVNDNLLNDIISSGRQAAKRKGGIAGEALNFGLFDMNMPFVKTPSNVVMRLLDYTGASMLVNAPIAAAQRRREGRKLFSQLTKEEQRGVSQAIGRGAVGWGLLLFGYHLAKRGLMTGQTEKKEGG